MKKELILKEFAGQKCDVYIFTRGESSYVSFRSMRGYGYPTLDEKKLEKLIKIIRQTKGRD